MICLIVGVILLSASDHRSLLAAGPLSHSHQQALYPDTDVIGCQDAGMLTVQFE